MIRFLSFHSEAATALRMSKITAILVSDCFGQVLFGTLFLWEQNRAANPLDHQVRHVYLDVPHSTNPRPSWFGESIGHHEGDTLVVDTIGIDTRTFVDDFETPHSDKLHVIERFRMIDGGMTLEVNVHVEDSGAFAMPWNAIQRYRRVEPGRAENPDRLDDGASSSSVAGPLIEATCAENPVSHFGSEAQAIPRADRPIFEWRARAQNSNRRRS